MDSCIAINYDLLLNIEDHLISIFERTLYKWYLYVIAKDEDDNTYVVYDQESGITTDIELNLHGGYYYLSVIHPTKDLNMEEFNNLFDSLLKRIKVDRFKRVEKSYDVNEKIYGKVTSVRNICVTFKY